MPLTVVTQVVLCIGSWRVAGRLNNFWQAEQQLIRLINGLLLTINAMVLVQWLVRLALFLNHTAYSAATDTYLRFAAYTVIFILGVVICWHKMKQRGWLDLMPHMAEACAAIAMEAKEATAPVRPNLLSDVQQKVLVDTIEAVLYNKKLFRDADLSMEQVAILTGAPRMHIAEALNRYRGETFHTCINRFRINDVLEQLERAKDKQAAADVSVIAFEAGFKSKQAFNFSFTKVMGMTPAEYLQLNNIRL
ncbi:helix-turn-helix domain-containing protein [Deminuibacter soli]|uniref:helix-turn-helix domain-containing protein n=1 Tax=Deminuibacter soli TaxID=2291815 RepID=UPI001314A8D6|nr:helix-turn-helix domain-containing protein [Deminuibacter soli]